MSWKYRVEGQTVKFFIPNECQWDGYFPYRDSCKEKCKEKSSGKSFDYCVKHICKCEKCPEPCGGRGGCYHTKFCYECTKHNK